MICKAASATTGHQITQLERIILSASKYTPKNSMSQKEEKEADLQRDLWQTPEEEVDEINNRHHREHWSSEHWHLICKFLLYLGILPPFDVYRQVQTRDENWENSLSPLSQFFFLSKQQLSALTISLLFLFRGEKKKKPLKREV